MRGIEPPLRAWEARVLPLNYIRGSGVSKVTKAVLGHGGLVGARYLIGYEQRCDPPGRHQGTDHEQEHHPAPPELPLDSGGKLAPAMLTPCQEIANQECQAESGDHLCEQGVDAQDVDHESSFIFWEGTWMGRR